MINEINLTLEHETYTTYEIERQNTVQNTEQDNSSKSN